MNALTSRRLQIGLLALAWLPAFAVVARAAENESAWRAAAAKVSVTPDEPMYLAGFGNRVVPAEGTALDLAAKALAIEDGATKTRLVIVTLDLLDVPILLREELEKYVAAKHKLPRESLLVNCSHTHCGPELRFSEEELAAIAPERAAMCRRYNRTLVAKLSQLIDTALAELAPAQLRYGHARCGFAMNRRLKAEPGDPELYLNRPNPDGVVDHDVPVLKVESPDGVLRAVLFGYACHNTTLNFKRFHGDYAGTAQHAIEAKHPNVVALFMLGCGGDQNGYPRFKPEYSEQHGRSLALAVEAALEAKSRPVRGPLRLAYDSVALDFQPPPSIERLKARIATKAEYPKSQGSYLLEWDQRRLACLEKGTLIKSYPFPAQVVRFGDDLLLIGLSGETVVDFSLRFKRELAGPAAVWVAGYCNDVFAYVPSKRVLLEGGYEAERAMSYGTKPVMPGPFAPTVEETIVNHVGKLLKATAP
ncbi:MAG: neutral/alkaline non-lysosomal ceramidase N-terminal domain-containing protein [Planctomycetia bacterium]|nr:neutral/alkaline non-lysosomal ceramidase N-terminal domain-containing protein [Planctomycetia bacterium]